MIPALGPVLRTPGLRLAALLLILNGVIGATLAPYASLIGIERLGLSHEVFAAMIVCASTVFVTSSVLFGILGDQRLDRRRLSLAAAGALATGTGLMSLFPTAPVFLLAHGVLTPFGGTLFVQSFALAREAAAARPEAERPAILTTIRAGFALPWVLVLPVWSVLFRTGIDILWVYPVACAAALVLVAVLWRAGRVQAGGQVAGGLSLRAALRELSALPVMARVVLLGPASSIVALYMTLLGLVLEGAGRPAGDVALYAAGLAGLEVPFMLMLPRVLARFGQTQVIAAGTVLYCCHLALLAPLAATPFVWLLLLPGAMGGAAILTQPIAYMQDLLADRPGAGASLMALQKIAGDAVTALCFVVGTALAGYWLVALFGAGLALLGSAALLVLDRRRSGPGLKIP